MMSENLAREMWGTPSAAIGKRLREFPSQSWHEVIGVAQDVRENGVQEKAPEIMYCSSLMGDSQNTGYVLRTVTFAILSDGIDEEPAVWRVSTGSDDVCLRRCPAHLSGVLGILHSRAPRDASGSGSGAPLRITIHPFNCVTRGYRRKSPRTALEARPWEATLTLAADCG